MCICIIIDVYIVLYRREGYFKWITEQDTQILHIKNVFSVHTINTTA